MAAVSLAALVLVLCALWFFRPARHRLVDVLVSDSILEEAPVSPADEGTGGGLSVPADTPAYSAAADTGQAVVWGVEAESPLHAETPHLFGSFFETAKAAIAAEKAEAAAAARAKPRVERPAAASPFGPAPEPLFRAGWGEEDGQQESPKVIVLPPPLGSVVFGMGEADVRRMFDIFSQDRESDGPYEVLVLVHRIVPGSNAQTVRFCLTEDSLYRVEVRLRPGEGQTVEGLLETWQQRFREQYRGYPMAEAHKWSDGVVRLKVGRKAIRGYVWIEYFCRRAMPPLEAPESEVE